MAPPAESPAEPVAGANRELSLVTTPPALSPGSLSTTSVSVGPALGGPHTPPDRPSRFVILRVSGRLAARNAQVAMKRSIEDSGATEDEEPTKRARRGDLPAVVDEESADTEELATSQPMLRIKSGATRAKRTRGKRGSTAKARNPKTAPKAAPSRPPPVGQPLVWAKTRGGLCEALPYFRAFKGSLHSSEVLAEGFLVDQEVDKLDFFGSQVIITSV